MGIYKITNLINNKCYIGSSSLSIKTRWRGHLYALRGGYHENQHLQSSFNKYGEESLRFSVIEVVEVAEEVIAIEQKYIDELKPEYNMCRIAGSCLGKKHTKETIKKMSEVKLGHKHTEESKSKMSLAQKGLQIGKKHPMWGKHHTEEYKASMSGIMSGNQYGIGNKSKTGQTTSDETKLKMRGKIRSEEHKAKIGMASKENQYAKGYKHTDEAKAKMSLAGKGRKQSEEHKANLKEALRQRREKAKIVAL